MAETQKEQKFPLAHGITLYMHNNSKYNSDNEREVECKEIFMIALLVLIILIYNELDTGFWSLT